MQAQMKDTGFSKNSPAASRKILVVDDNETNRLVTGLMLEMLGYDHDQVGSGKEALGRLEKKEYAAILMDVRMPELDGLETTRRIRQFERDHNLPYLPVIAVTAEVGMLSKGRCMDAGMDGFITKPYTSAELADAMETFIEPSTETPQNSDWIKT